MEQCTRFSAVKERHTRGIALSTQTEEWRVCAVHPNYEVSNKGRVRNADTKRERKLYIRTDRDSSQYQVTLSTKNIRCTTVLQRLVAAAFLSDYDPAKEVEAIDGNYLNCLPSNLKMSHRRIRGGRVRRA